MRITDKLSAGNKLVNPTTKFVCKIWKLLGVFGGVVSIHSSSSGAEIPCFHCETPICIASEETKPIEEIQEGDFVSSFNAELKQVEYRQVVRVYKSYTSELIKLSYGDNSARATPGLPYFTLNRGWLEAQELTIGDQLLSIDGGSLTLDSKESEFGEFPVVNFEVDSTHTYFGCNVLIHNSNIPINLAVTGLRTWIGAGNFTIGTAPLSQEKNGVLGTPANANEDQIVSEIRNKAKYEAALKEHKIDPKSVPPVSGLPTFATQ